MKHSQVHPRRNWLHLGLFLVMVISLMFAPAAPAATVKAQNDAPQIKPVVVYPEAFAESLPASEVPPDLIKNGERKPVTPTPEPSSAARSSQSSEAAAPGEEYEFPMFPLPKGENAGAGSALPKGLNPLLGAGVASQAPQAGAPQALDRNRSWGFIKNNRAKIRSSHGCVFPYSQFNL